MSEAAESILKGAREALAYAKGDKTKGRETTVHVPDAVDVRAVRARLGLTQEQFAARFGFRLSTLRDWEQGRRRPEGPSRAFLAVIAKEPEAVKRALTE